MSTSNPGLIGQSPDTVGGPDPVGQLRAWLQSQQTMQPNTGHQVQQPGQQPQQRTDRSSAQGYGKRAAMHDFSASLQNFMGQVGQKIQQRKATEQQHTFDRFAQSMQGIQQAQQMMQESQAALKQNPQDQQAQQRFKQAQGALQQNQTILDSMFNGPHGEKNAKMLGKGFGIDDKNAATPERQAAIKAAMKAYGVGQRGANIISQLPQTSQPTGQQIKPPTGGQILQSEEKQQQMQQQQVMQQTKTMAQQGMSHDRIQAAAINKGIQVSWDDKGNMTQHIMTPQERSQVPYLKAQDDYQSAKTEALRAATDAKTNPNNPEMLIKARDAASRAVDAQARVLSAQAQMMRAQNSQAKEPPAVSDARKSLTKLNEDVAKTQLAMSQQNAGFFGSAKYDPVQAEKALDTLQGQIKEKQSVLDAYQAGKQSATDTSDDDILKELDQLK